MKIRLLYFILVFTIGLFVGLSRTRASPVSLGNASGFAALALNGNVTMGSSTTTITGPAGVASSGFSYTGNSTFKSDLYVNTGSTINLNGATPSNIFQSASTNSFLSQAITDANNASAQANNPSLHPINPAPPVPPNPPGNLGNVNTSISIVTTQVGNYVYTAGNISSGITINISAPAGSTVIVNITGTVGSNIDLDIAGGLTPNNVVYNVTGTDAINENLAGGTSIEGILLAPNSTVSLSGNAVVTGQVIAKDISLSGNADIIFSGPVTPEPSSLGVVAIGTAALLGHRFFRRRKPPG